MKAVIETFAYHRGLPYFIRFTDRGYRCGYVGIPFGFHLYNNSKDNLDFINSLDCHGGITYSDYKCFELKEINSVEFADGKYFWIGFDCAHAFDGLDMGKAMYYFKNKVDYSFGPYKEYPCISLEECCSDCCNIIDVILKEEDKNKRYSKPPCAGVKVTRSST